MQQFITSSPQNKDKIPKEEDMHTQHQSQSIFLGNYAENTITQRMGVPGYWWMSMTQWQSER